MRNVQSADKAMAILSAFDKGREDLGVSELAAELGMHKSTAQAARHPRAQAPVRRVGDRFAPGPELARLGGLAVRSALYPGPRTLERLAEGTGETVNLAVRPRARAIKGASGGRGPLRRRHRLDGPRGTLARDGQRQGAVGVRCGAALGLALKADDAYR